ncbi:MAG: RNA methyltransferase, partial [Erysipelotrichaceae bacterium]|nr:RNA methyltransferase [Erysipelotrichaceae bacterium]
TGHTLVRGLWVALKRKPDVEVEEFFKDKKRIAVLVDVANPANVGAIFRSAAALGMDGVLLTHASVDPLTRRTARTSMGTVFQIPWAQAAFEDSNGAAILKTLNSHGFKTVAMALTEDSTSVDNDDIRANDKVAVLLGTEGTGLPKDVIAACDYRVMIPMYHGVDSLNVAAASAISFWELMK